MTDACGSDEVGVDVGVNVRVDVGVGIGVDVDVGGGCLTLAMNILLCPLHDCEY